MRKKVLLSAVFLLFAAAVSMPVAAQNIIPQPENISLLKGQFKLNKGTKIVTNLTGSDFKMLNQYTSEVLKHPLAYAKNPSQQGVFRLICKGTAQQAAQAMDSVRLQGYELEVTPKGITIQALTPTGLFYGLQTLRQLEKDGQIACVKVKDAPRFAYRGLMIDCSRHFWSKDEIKKQLDAMAYFKLDRFHWHLTDGGGWRMEVKKYPRLTEETAYRTESDWTKWWNGKNRQYSPDPRRLVCWKGMNIHGGYYTQDDIKEIVDYAAARHITIIPEIEMPGHSDEVVYAYPELSCTGKPYTQSDLCVGKEQTYTFMANVLKEVMRLFPSKYIHIGGDEAERRTWKTCPDCQRVMKDYHLKDVAELQSHFTHRIERFLNDNGRKLLGWDEIMEGTLAPNAAVMSWRGTEAGLTAAKSGHHVVMAPQEFCYLNMYQDDPMTEPKAQGGYTRLEKTYNYDPIPAAYKGTSLEKYIDGVQGCVWTEFIEKPDHLEYMIYPRLLALAETGWTKQRTGYADFRQRVITATDALKRAGYNAFDIRKEKGARPESRSIVQHEALGKPVTYLGRYAEKYRAEGDSTLTNGLRGDWGYLEGRWQGFIDSTGVDVVVDMGKVTDIRDVRVDFMHLYESVIYTPETIELMVSDDGKNFKTIDTVRPGIKASEDYLVYPYKWKGDVKGRYVRVKALSREKDAWIFTDEIIVNEK
ncbi:family 20 glycosylhydrolase [Prevotella melaninogenica]|uniref:glycoside hydrolase family 20 protein n=1 Tax=Prevotella melaninogenica TaxID=28132 RepID=UPI001C5E2C46|nr:family 20 glycosylhydrolase [Prevotella melaninogenica]MBW4742004.1 family 20 glycosylhydrolase [Prevotella melaninogenica]MBW4911588.1 family 20 glycosylhydrolase [Prevotella melaninogenica]